MKVTPEDLTLEVQKRYGETARRAQEGDSSGCCGTSCCGGAGSGPDAGAVALDLGYSEEDVATAGEGNLGLGCGNPLALAAIRPGMTVLDLGSGAGFDAFLAAEKVGPTGRVIGVDMTPEMLDLARRNAQTRGATHVEFREGRIERLPVESSSVDLVISNCVINLSTDKPAVFAEIARVLKPGGTISVSDIVLVRELPESVRSNVLAHVGCIAGASAVGEYVARLLDAGLVDVTLPRVAPIGNMLDGIEGITGGEAAAAAHAVVSALFVARKPARANT
ncbi:MAG: arsenite methyltransferase [Candidatus Eiseniibacteriota bacterium]